MSFKTCRVAAAALSLRLSTSKRTKKFEGDDMGFFIDRNGIVDDERVKVKIFPLIENRPMGKVNGIVVHQTGGSTADGAFSSYSKMQANGRRPNGAHFMIE